MNYLKLISTLILALALSVNFTKSVYAQEISLSVSPPLTEVVIQPGRETVLKYDITNLSTSDFILKASLFKLFPADEFGLVNIVESESYDERRWFTFPSKFVRSDNKFPLAAGQTKTFDLVINVPEKARVADYYLTLLFETDTEGLIVQNTNFKARIGTNILISVSNEEFTTPSAAIGEFKVTPVVDSLFPPVINLVVENKGPHFFKPEGKITIKPLLGKETLLTVAPQNILSYSKRNLLCLEAEKVIPCKIPGRVLIGLYTLKLDLDIEGQSLSSTIYTVAIPFTILAGLAIAFLSLRLFLTSGKKLK